MPSSLICLLVATLFAPAGAPTAAWAPVAPGLEYREIGRRAESTLGSSAIHAFRFSPDDFELRVLPAAEGRGDTARALGRAAGALLAVNGGFFLEGYAPLGLLVSQGRELNPLRRVDWGVFYVARGRAGLVHRRDWAPPEGLEFAVEAGPRLVVDGRPLTLKPQRARRTALGITPDGRVLVVVTSGRMLTSELADLLARPEAEGGLGCRFALNLDGGSSTQLWFDGVGRRVEVPGVGRVANAIGVFPRR